MLGPLTGSANSYTLQHPRVSRTLQSKVSSAEVCRLAWGATDKLFSAEALFLDPTSFRESYFFSLLIILIVLFQNTCASEHIAPFPVVKRGSIA
jgi:hypothetical protein